MIGTKRAFDQTKLHTLHGTVTQLDFVNPHVVVWFDVASPDGTTTKWSGWLTAPNKLQRAGWTKHTLSPGDKVTVVGNQQKNGSPLLQIRRVAGPDGVCTRAEDLHRAIGSRACLVAWLRSTFRRYPDVAATDTSPGDVRSLHRNVLMRAVANHIMDSGGCRRSRSGPDFFRVFFLNVPSTINLHAALEVVAVRAAVRSRHFPTIHWVRPSIGSFGRGVGHTPFVTAGLATPPKSHVSPHNRLFERHAPIRPATGTRIRNAKAQCHRRTFARREDISYQHGACPAAFAGNKPRAEPNRLGISRESGMSVAIRLTIEMRVRLTRKLAEAIDGVDLSGHSVGETFDLPRRDARLLIAEGWAQPDLRGHGSSVVIAFRRATDPGPLHRDEDELSRAS